MLTRVCILSDTTAFIYYRMRTLISSPMVWMAVMENTIRRTSYHSRMMQGNAKSSQLYCQTGMNALVCPRCTLHAFQATLLFSHYICSWKENIQKTVRTEAAVDKKPASYEIGLFPGEVEDKTQIHSWVIFYWEARSLLWDPIWLRSSQTWNPSHITCADADKSVYFMWHHCFQLLLNENIDIISNGVDGCCGKHYSQDFISFPNDAGERKVFPAVLSDWNECPGRLNCTVHAFPRLYSYSPNTSAPEKRTFRRRSPLRRLWIKKPLPTK